MKHVFLDANILFSASMPHTNMHGYFFRLAHKAHLTTSPKVYQETERNLLKKYPECLKNLAQVMQRVSLVADVAENGQYEALRQKDRHVIAAAEASKADYLLTGDVMDFGQFFGNKIGRVRVMSPVMLAMELDKNA